MLHFLSANKCAREDKGMEYVHARLWCWPKSEKFDIVLLLWRRRERSVVLAPSPDAASRPPGKRETCLRRKG